MGDVADDHHLHQHAPTTTTTHQFQPPPPVPSSCRPARPRRPPDAAGDDDDAAAAAASVSASASTAVVDVCVSYDSDYSLVDDSDDYVRESDAFDNHLLISDETDRPDQVRGMRLFFCFLND